MTENENIKKRPLNFDEYAWSTQIRLKRLARDISITSSENSTDEEDIENGRIRSTVTQDVNSFQSDTTDSEIEELPDERCDGNRNCNEELDDTDEASGFYDSADSYFSNDEAHITDEANEFTDTSDDSETDDEIHRQPDDGDTPLYPGAPITVISSLLAILTFVLRHKLTGACISDLLELVAMHCITPNYCKSSLYKFKKVFANVQTQPRKHFYCAKCFSGLENEFERCRHCPERTDRAYFIEIPIIDQLKALFKRPGFYDKLNHRFSRVHHKNGHYEDIYDGEMYKQLASENGILASRNNISFTWYTDGVNIFNSSKFSIWPFFLVINELPFEERFKIENVLLAEMWFGSEKPIPNLFLLPLHASTRQLLEGIEVNIPNINLSIVVKGIILCGTCDLPAKALFMNMNQYNGKYGCQKCLQPGQLTQRVRVYPYENPLTLRTDLQTQIHAREAHETDSKVFGVKGPALISRMVYKCIETTAVDPMHCVYGGVVKRLSELWFLPKFADARFSISRYVKLVDNRLNSICPPEFVQRRPRSIESHGKYWKASEYKNWFFYFSLPILSGILKVDYFNHYQLLVLGITLLCSSSISDDMINTADQVLNEFVSRFENLYGVRHMSCNLHHLLHLADVVRNLGPLWISSCFPFEDLNGKLKAMVHGSNAAQLQINFVTSLYVQIFTLKDEKLIEGTRAYAFCKKLLSPKRQLKLQPIANSTFIAGSLKKMQGLPDNVRYEYIDNDFRGENLYCFKKLFKNNLLYTSQLYNRVKKTASFCAKYIVNNEIYFGLIQYFIRDTDCFCINICICPARYYAAIKRCDSEFVFQAAGKVLSLIRKIRDESPDITLVNINYLKSVCFLVKMIDSNNIYIIEPVNCIEEE